MAIPTVTAVTQPTVKSELVKPIEQTIQQQEQPKPQQATITKQPIIRLCAYCGNDFEALSHKADYCDANCRQAQHRRRLQAKTSKDNSIPLQVSNSVTSTLEPLPDSELPIKHNGRLVTSVTLAKED